MRRTIKNNLKITLSLVLSIILIAGIFFSISAFTKSTESIKVLQLSKQSVNYSTNPNNIVFSSSKGSADYNIEEIRSSLHIAVAGKSSECKSENDAREQAEAKNNPEVKGTSNNTAVDIVQQPQPQASLNDYEAAVLYLINTIRAENGLGALTANQALNDIARSRSTDLLNRNYFSHYTPEGKTIFNFLKENGVGYRNAGENLAHSMPASIGSPDAFMNAWMNSPSHKANILRGAYTQIGISVVDNGDRKVLTTVFIN
ncbi:MAG: hypothetical protein H8E13_20940 [Actinobacteria bacterium]|nr:hypothetical protein [Actinomycetota bacterium]